MPLGEGARAPKPTGVAEAGDSRNAAKPVQPRDRAASEQPLGQFFRRHQQQHGPTTQQQTPPRLMTRPQRQREVHETRQKPHQKEMAHQITSGKSIERQEEGGQLASVGRDDNRHENQQESAGQPPHKVQATIPEGDNGGMTQDLAPLFALLRIPSISTDPEFAPRVRECAEMVANLLRTAGLDSVELLESPGRHPLVYGDWLHAPGAPTLLLYGHYDVQPPEPLDEWISPPFEPAIRGEHLYARGVADDKGLLLILIHAVERLIAAQRLGVNIKFLIEGEEECGGEHLTEYVRSHPARLAGLDAAAICDTEMFAPELPTICVGLRGMVYGEIHVEGARQDLHSGVYGGAAPNAPQALAQVLTALKGPDHRVNLPGFYDAVVPPTEAEREAWARLPFDAEQYRQNEVMATALVGEAGVPLFERLWARPTFEVHGILGGFTGTGTKTVIPARAMAKVSCRLVPNQQPEAILSMIQRAVAEAAPVGTRAEFRLQHIGPPSSVDPANRFVQAAAMAMTAVFGVETVFTRSGGSIPVVALLASELNIPSVMMGFGLPDDNLHAPNERLYLPNFHRGIVAVEKYLENLKYLKKT